MGRDLDDLDAIESNSWISENSVRKLVSKRCPHEPRDPSSYEACLLEFAVKRASVTSPLRHSLPSLPFSPLLSPPPSSLSLVSRLVNCVAIWKMMARTAAAVRALPLPVPLLVRVAVVLFSVLTIVALFVQSSVRP